MNLMDLTMHLWFSHTLLNPWKIKKSLECNPNFQEIQEEEMGIGTSLPYVEGTSEELRRILRSHKLRSPLYTENTLCKLLCKPKYHVATEN